MLGARIAMLRKNKRMSQRELARLLEISPSAVGMYEQGRREPDCAALVSMAKLFGVSTDYLLTGKAGDAELSALRAAFADAMKQLPGELTLRSADGSERPFGAEELALLAAALLG